MLEELSRTRRNVVLAVLAALLLWGAWAVRAALNPFIAGYFLAFVLHPMVLALQRRGWSRRRAVNSIFLVSALLLTVVAVGASLQALQWAARIADPSWRATQLETLDAFLAPHTETLESALAALDISVPSQGAAGHASLTSELVMVLGREWHRLAAPLGAPDGAAPWGGLVSRVVSLFGSAFNVVAFLALLPIYAYFLLFQLEALHAWVRRYIPWRQRERVTRVGEQIGEVLSAFFRGRLLVSLLKGVLIAIFLWLGGVKYALLLGLSAGVLSLLPFVGPMLSFLFAFLVALVDKDYGFLQALLRTAPAFFLAEVLEGYVLLPKILGESLGLHEVVVLLSVFVGGAAFGAFGILLALPVTATLVILFREFVQPSLERFADEDPVDAPGT